MPGISYRLRLEATWQHYPPVNNYILHIIFQSMSISDINKKRRYLSSTAYIDTVMVDHLFCHVGSM